MQLEMKSDSLMVAKVDSRGNAREAGVKKGDTIIEAGGAVIGSVEELEEISKILGQGDQLEFKIDRRGKKNTVMIQFGTAPELDEMVESTAKTKNDFSLIRKSDDKQTSATRLVPPASSGTVVGSGLKRVDVQQTIEQQRNQIEQMQKQIERLKNQQTNLNSIIEVPEFRNRADEKASGGPNLSGPGR